MRSVSRQNGFGRGSLVLSIGCVARFSARPVTMTSPTALAKWRRCQRPTDEAPIMTDMHTELELAQRYAAGRLDAGTTATFEEHLVVCERCQDEVRLTARLRKVMRLPGARSSGGRW